MSSQNNKGTQYDPPGDSVWPTPNLPKSSVLDGSTSKENVHLDSMQYSSEDESPILPPMVTITPRIGSRTRNSKKRPDYVAAADQVTTENASGDDKRSVNTGNLSASTEKSFINGGGKSGIDGGIPVVWTTEYRNKLHKQDTCVRSRITAYNSHPQCFKPPTAAMLSKSLTHGEYLPGSSSVQFVVKNEIDFWPSANRGVAKVERDVERVTYSRYATRGTGRHSARLKSDEERQVSPRLLTARKGNIVTNRLSLSSRANGRPKQHVIKTPLKLNSDPAFIRRLDTSSLPAVKLHRLQNISEEDQSKPIDGVANTNRRHLLSSVSDCSDPTPSEFEEATGKVRAWITHRQRVGLSQDNPLGKQPSAARGLWGVGMSPLQRDMIMPLRRAHPLVRSTITVGNFMTDCTASKGAAVRIAPRGIGSRRQIIVPF